MAAYRCGLTACTPGSAPGPMLGNEYGRTLPLTLLYMTPVFHIIVINSTSETFGITDWAVPSICCRDSTSEFTLLVCRS